MTERIFITGDKHGSFYPLFGLADHVDLQASDVLLIAGDAGYVWDENYHGNVETLQQLFPGTIAFIDGNHENHQMLSEFDETLWSGGRAHQIAERIFHLMRGELYSIYGKNFFTLGGARSVDKHRREEGISWWKEEEPSAEEMEYATAQLEKYIDQIDYVITHETPLFARDFIKRTKEIDEDYTLPALLDEWYQRIQHQDNFCKWYFGHMHVDQTINPQLRALHNEILLIGEDEDQLIRWV